MVFLRSLGIRNVAGADEFKIALLLLFCEIVFVA